jgi:predicted dehydrogenase
VPVSVRQSFASRPPRRTITVAGEHGAVRVDLLAARVIKDSRVTDSRAAPAVVFPDYQRNQMFMDEARHFEACVAGREKPSVPLEDGIAVLRLALAVKDAMRTGRAVEIN